MEENERSPDLVQSALTSDSHSDANGTDSAESQVDDVMGESSINRNATLPLEIGSNEISKLKGDAIGETLYSERWVLRQLMVLLEFTPERFSKTVEDDLCLLWDMTVEEDIVKFLLKHDFFSIAVHCFKPSTPPRISEIVVGIIGNMCRISEARQELALHRGLHSALLELLFSTDSLLLLQLMRLLSTCIWHLHKTDDSIFNNGLCLWLITNKDKLDQQLSFILTSSLSSDLLCCTLELVHNLCCVSNGNASLSLDLASNGMVEGLLEAMQRLINSLDKDEEGRPTWASDVEKALEHSAVVFDLFALNESGILLLSDHSDDLAEVFASVLSSLGESNNSRILNRHKWQLLGSIANTLHCLGEHNGFAPSVVLPHIIRLLPHLPKLSSGLAPAAPVPVPSFEDDDEFEEVHEEDIDEFIDVHINIVRYCVVALSVLDTEDLVEAFSQNPSINVVELYKNLQKSSNEELQKVAKLMLSLNLVKL